MAGALSCCLWEDLPPLRAAVGGDRRGLRIGDYPRIPVVVDLSQVAGTALLPRELVLLAQHLRVGGLLDAAEDAERHREVRGPHPAQHPGEGGIFGVLVMHQELLLRYAVPEL